MKSKHVNHEPSASNYELARRLADLELRVAVHDEILSFLKTVLDQLNESRSRLVLTKEQRARLNRWLRDHETNPKSGFSRFDLN